MSNKPKKSKGASCLFWGALVATILFGLFLLFSHCSNRGVDTASALQLTWTPQNEFAPTNTERSRSWDGVVFVDGGYGSVSNVGELSFFRNHLVNQTSFGFQHITGRHQHTSNPNSAYFGSIFIHPFFLPFLIEARSFSQVRLSFWNYNVSEGVSVTFPVSSGGVAFPDFSRYVLNVPWYLRQYGSLISVTMTLVYSVPVVANIVVPWFDTVANSIVTNNPVNDFGLINLFVSAEFNTIVSLREYFGGHWLRTFSEGYSLGRQSGWNDGVSFGYSQGFQSGYAQGDFSGFSRGYLYGEMTGQTIGWSQGFDVGFSQGFEDGHRRGWLDGVNDSVAGTDFFGILIRGFFSFFDALNTVQLFPGFTLGMFIGFILILGLVGSFIGLKIGGD